MIKKILAACVLIFLFLGYTFVYAQDSIAQQVKSKIDIPSNYIIFDSSKTDGNISKLWWRSEDGAENGGEISVTADENGNILSYYHFKNDYISKDEGAHFSVYNKSDSRFFALRFIEKVCPELAEKVEYNSRSLESDISKNLKTASVSFYRVENGIPYYENYMDFIIDLNTSEVIQYTLNWDFDAVFPPVDDLITQQAALRQYNSKIGIWLRYRLKTENGINKAYLVYVPQDDALVIDAYTGKAAFSESLNSDTGYFEDTSFSNYESGSFTEEEIAALSSSENFMSVSEAESYARSITESGITEDYTLTLSSYAKINDRYCINLEFSRIPTQDFEEMTEEEKLMYLSGDYSYVRLKIDMYTRDIISMSCYNKEAKIRETPISDTAAKWFSDNFIMNYLPSKYSNCVYDENKFSNTDGICKFVYTCYIGNIPLEGSNITVEYDCNKGIFVSLTCVWYYDVEFESAAELLSETKANEIFFTKVPLQLTYISSMSGIKPVYALYPFYPAAIGGVDGILKNKDGTDFKIKRYAEYVDIEGHYAQGMIMRLNNNLIITSDSDSYFCPDSNISQKDFLNWINTALTGTSYENTEELYKYLTANYIVLNEEISPEAEILKEDAIVFFIRALGYDSIAQAEDIYKLNFSDTSIISPEKIGYIALAKGIGMISGDENNRINPKTPLTRADACCMIYKYLAR